jgi:hypothetical protein
MKLLALSGLVLVVGGQPAMTRTINLGDDSRRCLSSAIIANLGPA